MHLVHGWIPFVVGIRSLMVGDAVCRVTVRYSALLLSLEEPSEASTCRVSVRFLYVSQQPLHCQCPTPHSLSHTLTSATIAAKWAVLVKQKLTQAEGQQ